MKTGDQEDAGRSARAILARVDWRAMLPVVLQGARHYLATLGWAEGTAYRPAVLEAHELVNTTFDRLQTGQRALPAELCQTDAGFVRVFSKAMFNVAMSRARHVSVMCHDEGDDATDPPADERPTASRRLHACSLIERLQHLFQGDAEAQCVLGGFAEGYLSRDDIREHLGWSVEHLKAVLQRMTRRSTSARLHPNGDEAEPEGSGPHRRDDETAHAGGRHGSPPEHDRRSRHAGRRP